MKQGQVLFLNEEEIESILTNEKTLEIVDSVLKAYANGKAVNPIKLSLSMNEFDGRINSMPSYNKETSATGVKIVSVYYGNNKKYNIPTTLGTIVLHDMETGMPYAIMGGTHITNMRTGAAAGLKSKYLAKKDSRIIAIVGAGVQGYTSLDMTLTALGADSKIEEVRVSDLLPEHREHLIAKAKEKYPNLRYISCEDNASAVEGADIALMCSGAPVPILESCEISEGTLCVCVSESLTRKSISKFDRFYADFIDCVLERTNTKGRINAEKLGKEYVDLERDVFYGEIGEAMVGKIDGRLKDTDRLLTRDAGMSIEDIGVARYVYEEAVARGIGKVLDFQNL